MSGHEAICGFLAVALFGGLIFVFFGKCCFVLTLYGLLYIGHCAVTYIQCVSVEDLVEGGVFGEFFFNYFQKFPSNVRGYIFTVGWIIPVYVPETAASFCIITGQIHTKNTIRNRSMTWWRIMPHSPVCIAGCCTVTCS